MNGESPIDFFWVAEKFVLHFVATSALIMVPYSLISLSRWAIRAPAIREFRQVPLLLKLTMTAGVLFAYVGIMTRLSYGLESIDTVFATNGPWDIPLSRLWLERVNPIAFDVSGAIENLFQRQLTDVLVVSAALAALGLLAACAISMRMWYFSNGLLACLACVLVTVVTAYIVIYTASVMLWMLNRLNFLLFLMPLAFLRPMFRFRHSRK